VPFVIICMGFALAGGIIGRLKGSSFLLWFILAGIPLYYAFSRRRPADAPALR